MAVHEVSDGNTEMKGVAGVSKVFRANFGYYIWNSNRDVVRLVLKTIHVAACDHILQGKTKLLSIMTNRVLIC